MANKDFMDPELTEEEKRETILANEDDYLEGLLAAADNAANDTKKIEIIRNERKYFSFSIHSLTDEMLKDIRKKYTKYTKNRRQGIRVADELDMPKYRASVIYNSTTEEDKAKLWDNPDVKKGLEAKGICIINALDVIDAVLLPGEKDRIMEIIDCKKLIMAGGKSTLLHHIFQRQGLLPSEVMSLPSGERAFLFASTRLWIEANTKKG